MLSKVDAFASDPSAFALDNERIEQFITRWQGREGGQERANYVLFLTELCTALGLPQPDPAGASSEHNDYVFERAVTRVARDGSVSHPRIDLYRRGCFILEAKQSRLAGARNELAGQLTFPDLPTANRGKKSAERAWDVLMFNARQQAEGYVRLLPAGHEPPPFLVVCDVGHCFEVYANFRRDGKVYDQFPDRRRFRIYLDDLRHEVVRERLRLIWTDPLALDPARQSAVVTRGIAERLAAVSKALEAEDNAAEEVAAFLMRCLFTMFAEDVGLLPAASFKNLLERCEADPRKFVPTVGQLWEAMDTGGYAHGLEAEVRRFNGDFFKNCRVLPLRREDIGELRQAASHDWRQVDPSIFGTLLEQALDPNERRRLGAHYTPRSYVERLVVATVIEPLREDWLAVYSTADLQKAEGRIDEAQLSVAAFHNQLCKTRVLDPACGTGNFLYVALELMKRLEGEVLDALSALGGQEALLGLESHSVGPQQFFGLEVNPRAAAIAELVLWIGHLQWHVRTRGGLPSDPILKSFKNIVVKDAVLEADKVLAVDTNGGRGPNGTSIELYKYLNSRRPSWPEAEFIVGNPPFIGGKRLRSAFGDIYVENLWSVHPDVNDSADYVIYWWSEAASILTRRNTVLRSFGFVTTNSISQDFNRRTIEKYLNSENPISLTMVIPDHPWLAGGLDAAAVRIAMTVARAGKNSGVLISAKEKTKHKNIEIDYTAQYGNINSDLTIGSDLSSAQKLLSNEAICQQGVKLVGNGFIIQKSEVPFYTKSGDHVVKPYVSGKEITSRPRSRALIDFHGLDSEQARRSNPIAYQRVLELVKPLRDVNREPSRRKNWWLFGRTNVEMRDSIKDISRFIVTPESSKYRLFTFVPKGTIIDASLYSFALDDAWFLGVLSSKIHETWALRAGGKLGVGNDPRYFKSRTFDPFPFPLTDDLQRRHVRAIAEDIDNHRKRVMAEHPNLTLTSMYNVIERLRCDVAAADLEANERRIFDDGLLLILKDLHDQLDVAVGEAYGWPANLSGDKILVRLMALNKERIAEEARGIVRWLRADYQVPRLRSVIPQGAQTEADLIVQAKKETKPLFPQRELDQMAVVLSILLSEPSLKDAPTIASRFRQGKKVEKKVAAVLAAVERTGVVLVLDRGRANG